MKKIKKLKKWYVVVLVVVFTVIAGMSSAETLLGKNYIGGSFGIIKFDDNDRFFEDNIDVPWENDYRAYGFVGNINLNGNLDLQLGVGYEQYKQYEKTDGYAYLTYVKADIKIYSAQANLVYFFKPSEKVNPYVGVGIAVIDAKMGAISYEKSSDTEVGFGSQVGVELELIEQLWLDFGLHYFNIDSENDFIINAGVGYWFNKQIMGALSCAYNLDSENALASLGLIISFSKPEHAGRKDNLYYSYWE